MGKRKPEIDERFESMDMGDWVRQFRNHYGLSQRQIAEFLGCGRSTISAFENGWNIPQSIKALIHIMGILEPCFAEYLEGNRRFERIDFALSKTLDQEIKRQMEGS